MTGLSYSILASNTIEKYRLAALGQHGRDSFSQFSAKQNNKEAAQFNYFKPIDRIEISNTISQLSSKAYMELRGQNENLQATRSLKEDETNLDSGYWGSEQTASRILETAKGLGAGNIERIGIIVDAVKKGFKDAQFSTRGDLPDVSLKTQDKVFTQLDSWAESFKLSDKIA